MNTNLEISTETGAITATSLYVASQVLGPTLEEVGQDFKKLYIVGRDAILKNALKKISNPEDKGIANLRVTRDIFWNGSFSSEAICAEYFGGILASSRSHDGNDDNGIYYTDVIKSLSSEQLHLHYIVYNSLNKLLVSSKKEINVGLSSDIQGLTVYLNLQELTTTLGFKYIDTAPNILWKQGLIHEYQLQNHILENGSFVPYLMIRPTTFGVTLYAISHNLFTNWREFGVREFGDFEDIQLPQHYSENIESLSQKIGKPVEKSIGGNSAVWG